MKRVFSVTLILIALGTAKICMAGENDVLKTIEKQIDTCINKNNYSLTPPEDCNASAEQTLLKSPQSAELMMGFAGIIRRKLGNHVSLKYYKQALDHKVTPERCIDDGLDYAVNYGLGLSAESYPEQVKFTQDIVFKQCWAEWKDEIIAMSKESTSSMWLENVCNGAQSINAKALIPTCN